MRKRVAKIRHEIGMISVERKKTKLQYRFLQKLLWTVEVHFSLVVNNF